MLMKCILKNINGDIVAQYCGNGIDAIYDGEYKEGFCFEVMSDCDFIKVTFDESQKESIVYAPMV
mgnify:CR=1 FL=1